MSGINQYNNYNSFDGYKAYQNNNDQSFERNPDLPVMHPLASGVGEMAARPFQDNKADSWAVSAGMYAGGMAASWGLNKGVDVFSRSGVNPKKELGVLENTRMYKWMEKLDSFSQKNSAVKYIEGKLAGIGNTFGDWHNYLSKNSSLYKKITDIKSTGKETWMVGHTTTHHQFIDELAGELKKLPESETTVLKSAFETLEKGNHEQAYEEIKTVLENNAHILGKVSSDAKGILGGLKQKAITGKFNAGKVEILMNKIGLLQKAEKSGLLARMFAKGSIITGHFLGGGPFGIILNGFFLGGTIKSTIDAKKGEKVSTFMEDFLGNWIGNFAMWAPISLAINKAANLKFIEGKGIGTNIVKGIGHVIGFGLKKGGAKSAGFLEHAAEWGGKGGRMLFVLFVVAPIVSNIFTKVSHLIFGTPTKSKEKEKEESKPVQRQTNENINQNAVQPSPFQGQIQPQVQPQMQTQPIQKYIPSPNPAPDLGKSLKDDKISKAIQVSDMAMQNAQNILKNINSM